MLQAVLGTGHREGLSAIPGSNPFGRNPMSIVLRRSPNGEPETNVPYYVSRADEEDIPRRLFEWGYIGAGPNELAMNVLFNAGASESDASRLSSFFAHDIIAGIPRDGI